MHLSLWPQRRDETLTVSKAGDVLTINGEDFDFSSLPDGATIPAGIVPCAWVLGPVDRIDGMLHLTLSLPFGSAPEVWQTHPEPLVDVPDGPVDIPVETTVEHETAPVQGGFLVITTTRRWHQAPEISTTFVPDITPTAEDQEIFNDLDA